MLLRPLALILAALTVLGSMACSTPSIVYQRLDWLADWRLNDYVTLNPEQKAQFNRDFGELWRWHREQELPAYASDMRELAAALDSSVTPAQIADYSERFRGHWQRAMARTVPALCPVVQSFDEAQVQEILDEVDEDTEKYLKDSVEPSAKELRRNSEQRMGKWIKRWNGPLNARQQELLKQWSGQRRATAPEWLDYRQQWRSQLEQALRDRKSSARCEPLEALFVNSADLRSARLAALMAHNETLWQEFIADIIAAAEPRQGAHAQAELREFAGQLDQLR
ncbi:MAG: DUF6279 family lipoprotein [Nevskiales bacterium]